MTAVLDPARGAAAPRAGRRRQSAFPYALLVPILVFEVVFVVYPIIRGILLSFHQTSFGVTKFVGWPSTARCGTTRFLVVGAHDI
jgi:ABC-type sugar transport system permease subunit